MKSWAKTHNINSSKDQTLNSLSIILFVAFHLQVNIWFEHISFLEALHFIVDLGIEFGQIVNTYISMDLYLIVEFLFPEL